MDDHRLADVNHRNNVGWTPVMFAMDENCVNALLELVYHPSVDLDARDWKGRSLEEVAR